LEVAQRIGTNRGVLQSCSYVPSQGGRGGRGVEEPDGDESSHGMASNTSWKRSGSRAVTEGRCTGATDLPSEKKSPYIEKRHRKDGKERKEWGRLSAPMETGRHQYTAIIKHNFRHNESDNDGVKGKCLGQAEGNERRGKAPSIKKESEKQRDRDAQSVEKKPSLVKGGKPPKRDSVPASGKRNNWKRKGRNLLSTTSIRHLYDRKNIVDT